MEDMQKIFNPIDSKEYYLDVENTRYILCENKKKIIKFTDLSQEEFNYIQYYNSCIVNKGE